MTLWDVNNVAICDKCVSVERKICAEVGGDVWEKGWLGNQEAGNDDEHENPLGDIRSNLRSLLLKTSETVLTSLPSVLLLIFLLKHDLSITVEIALRWWSLGEG